MAFNMETIKGDFKNFGHFIAATAKRFVAFSQTSLPKLAQEAETLKPLAEAAAAVVGPQAASIVDASYALFGAAAQDAESGGTFVKDLFAKVGTPQLLADFEKAVAVVKQTPVKL